MNKRFTIFYFTMIILAAVAGAITGSHAEDTCALADYETVSIERDLDSNVSFGIVVPNASSVTLCGKEFPADFVLTKEDKEQIAPDYLHAFCHGIIHHPEFVGVVEFSPQVDCFSLQGAFIGYEDVQCQAYAPDWD